MLCALPTASTTLSFSPATEISVRWSNALQQRGKRVSVVSTLQTQQPMVADELRRQSDQFIDLADLETVIGRDPGTRPAREPRTYSASRSPATQATGGDLRTPASFQDYDVSEEEV